MQVYVKDRDGKIETRSSIEGLKQGDWALLWIDLEGGNEEELNAVCALLNLHPLAIESCRGHSEVPKVQDFPNHAFITWSFLRETRDSGSITTSNICMFLGQTFLLTAHSKPIPELGDVLGKVKSDSDFYKAGPAAIVYSILDTAVDEYFPLVEELTDKIDSYVDDIVSGEEVGDVKELLAYKQTNMALRHSILSHRDVVIKLSRHDMPFVPGEVSMYMLDVYDHLARQSTDVEGNTDLISSSLDIHLNAVNNRLNVTMKRLTTIATIFMPLTFLVGLYGMNFKYMPELSWRYGYLLALVSLVVIALVMIGIAKWKQWF